MTYRQSSLRASDEDRELVAERLRLAAAEGRLTPEELEERLSRALRARTYGELSSLLADLPRQGAVVASASAFPLVTMVRNAALVLVAVTIGVPMVIGVVGALFILGHHVLAALFPLFVLWMAASWIFGRRGRRPLPAGRQGRYGRRGAGPGFGAPRRGGPGVWW